ncbi:uncharacterized protein [Amphiura filiformis]
MAEDGSGGVIARQPVGSLRGLFRSRSSDQPSRPELAALEGSPGVQAVANDYTDPPEGREKTCCKGGNNNDADSGNSSSNPLIGTNTSNRTPHNSSSSTRTSLLIVSDGQHGKTKVVKVVKREPSRTSTTSASSTTPQHVDSKEPYPCQVCGGCRCDKCRSRTELPKVRLCNGRCLCSAENTLEYCSCLVCVKTTFYHCTDSENEENYALVDDPCSCSSDRCCLRWSVMGVMSVFMPCLWLYVPGRMCIFGCKRCYAQGRHGCKCKDSADYT